MPTVYVATGGNDSRSYATAQVASTPWATIAHALATCATGDTVELRSTGGDITETFLVNSRAAVTIQNYTNESVIWQAADSSSRILGFENCQNIVIRKNPAGGSLTIRHTPTVQTSGGKNSHGLHFYYLTSATNTLGVGYSDAVSCTVDGVIFTGLRGRAIYAERTGIWVKNCNISYAAGGVEVTGHAAGQTCPGTIIESNNIHDLDKMLLTLAGGDGGDSGAQAITFNKYVDGGIRRNNRIWNCSTVSAQYGYDGGAFEDFGNKNCLTYGNEVWDNEGTYETGTDNEGAYSCSGNKFYNNYVHGFLNQNGASPCVLIRADNAGEFYNNTFKMGGGGGSGVTAGDIIRIQKGTVSPPGYNGTIDNFSFHDNIILMTNVSHKSVLFTAAPATVSWDYNLLYDPNSVNSLTADTGSNTYNQNNLAGFRSGTVYGDHDIWGTNPLLDSDGAPLASSPAIGVGTAGGTIGCFPYTAPVPANPARRLGRRNLIR